MGYKPLKTKELHTGQSLFDFGEELNTPITRTAPPQTPISGWGPNLPAQWRSPEIDQLVQQIARDTRVLREDPVYHHPSRAFYEERIADYRAEVQRLRADHVGRPAE